MKNLRLCDEIIEVDKKNKESVRSLEKWQAEAEFDYIICPHQSLRSHKIAKSINAKNKLGYKKWWNSSYFNQRIERQIQWPEAIRQLQLIALMDSNLSSQIGDLHFDYKRESLEVPEWASMKVSHLAWPKESYQEIEKKFLNQLSFSKPYICIAPGSVWETKRWTEEGFVKSAMTLARQGYQILILGAPDERELCEKVQRQVPQSLSMAGNLSIWQSMMVLHSARALICNDSGAMHMAAVVGTPIVSVFGPTVQELGYRPWSQGSIVLENNDLLCRPCGQHGGRKCPIGTHICMKSVSHNDVVDRIQLHLT
ncbi:MAG: glycosyltransferase family 9 protein [Bdellovibrionales bacterium]|nr:glycosyltransferase family 9 protein [Bdellovibrionales bacterium]NQZ18967.1 glycosyltransferase family 9 protein [Bdellovibrionales bacterium]